MAQIFPLIAVEATDGVTTISARTFNFTSGATVTDGGGGTVDISIVGGGSLPAITSTRQTYSNSSAVIPDLSSDTFEITASDNMFIGRIESDVPATIRLYTSAAARTADSGRGLGVPVPAGIEGLVAEIQTTGGNLAFDNSPTIAYINMEAVQNDDVYVLVFNESGGNSAVQVTLTANPDLASSARQDYMGATSSIPDLSSEDINIAAEAGLLIGQIGTDVPATVRVYNSIAARTADNARALGVPAPVSIEGLIAEVQTTGGNLDVDISPALGSINLESAQEANIYLKVFNESGGNSVVNVTISANPAIDTTRQTDQGTTASIADLASDDITINVHNVALFGRLATSAASTVRLYNSQAARTADARALGVPAPSSVEGLISEVQFTPGNLVYDLSPSVPFINLEVAQNDEVYARVFNESGIMQTISVSIVSNFGD